jgi:hypothetical protein
MAGFTSQDDLINQITTNSKFYRADWNKLMNPTAAAVAGEWHSLARGAGSPQADAIFNAGTALVHQQVFDVTTNGGGMYHGGNVGATGADFKTVLNASAFSAAATTMPAVAMLIDVLAFIRVTAVTTTTAQTVINSNTFTASSSSGLLLTYTNDFNNLSKVRFTNSGGALPTGLSINTDYWLIRVSATTARVATTFANAIAGTAIAFNATALGAGTPNLTLPSYTNAAGTASRATPSTPSPPIGKTAATNSHILYSGATGTGKMGPFVPLQSGDAGIQSIQTLQNSTSYVSGEYSVALCKPILTLPMTTLGVAAEREFVSQLPSFPRVYDGAALYWLLYSGAATPANSAFYGHVDFGWS